MTDHIRRPIILAPIALILLTAVCAYAWDFRDEVYACGQQGMTLAELQSAGVTLISHVPYTHEWMNEAARYGIRGMPYISLYKVYESAAGGNPEAPFWGEMDIAQHPEWVYIGVDGQRKRPFNNEFYPTMYWQSCTNTAGIADAYARGAAEILELGAGGVFIDNVLPAATCYGPQFGIHEHLHPELDNIETFKIALQGVQDRVHSFGPDTVVMLNIGGPFERWAPYGDCIMLESFIYNVDVRPGPGGWVGDRRVQTKQWPQILEWIGQTAEHVDGGGSVVALEYLPGDPHSAVFSYAADKLANFLWTGDSHTRRDLCRTLYRCRLQRASGPLQETEGLYWRQYPNGLVAVNASDRPASVSVNAPEGLPALADMLTDRVLPVRDGQVRLQVPPGAGGVYVTPQALAEGHLREALVATDTAMERTATDARGRKPAELLRARREIERARAIMERGTDPATARTQIEAALRTLEQCLGSDSEPGLTARLASGEELSREQVAAELDGRSAPQANARADRPTITAGGPEWTVGGPDGLIAARGMGMKLGLSSGLYHPTHGWLSPAPLLSSEVVAADRDRAALRATFGFTGAQSQTVIEGLELDLELEARAGDPMLGVNATVRNTGDAPLPAYFNMSSAGTGTWFASPGEPAQAGEDYLQIPHTDWTFVTASQHGGPGLLVVTDLPQSYSRFALHLYSEPRAGDLAPGAERSISFRIAPVAGPWQADPRVTGPLTRAQVYLSRAWSLASGGRGLPSPELAGDPVAGLPVALRLDERAAARQGLRLALEGAALLDGNGDALLPAEITPLDDGFTLGTRPSLRSDLYLMAVARVRTEDGLPLAIATDLQPGLSVALEDADECTWEGARGEARWTVTNRLPRDVQCQLEVSVPEGYSAVVDRGLTLGPGAPAEVSAEITAAQASAAPAEVTLAVTLPDLPGSGALAGIAAFRPRVACPAINAPALDGALDDAAWQQAAELPQFGLVTDGSAPADATRAWLGRDAEYLYVAFECMESQMDRLAARVQPAADQNDNAVHQDDEVEAFLDPPGELPYLQFAANALGARKTRGDARWEVATAREDDRWTVEMRVRLDSLGLPILPGARWGANFCRVQQRTGQASCWSPTGSSFHVPDRFGVIVFD